MNFVQKHLGVPVLNLCGRYYIELAGQRIGPFSALPDAIRQIETMTGGIDRERSGRQNQEAAEGVGETG